MDTPLRLVHSRPRPKRWTAPPDHPEWQRAYDQLAEACAGNERERHRQTLLLRLEAQTPERRLQLQMDELRRRLDALRKA